MHTAGWAVRVACSLASTSAAGHEQAAPPAAATAAAAAAAAAPSAPLHCPRLSALASLRLTLRLLTVTPPSGPKVTEVPGGTVTPLIVVPVPGPASIVAVSPEPDPESALEPSASAPASEAELESAAASELESKKSEKLPANESAPVVKVEPLVEADEPSKKSEAEQVPVGAGNLVPQAHSCTAHSG